MMYESMLNMVGNTPMLRLLHIEEALGLKSRVYAKLESFNPGGSVKDRIALSMIEDAEQRGVLTEGGTIIEPTSGNTGIGIAWIARLKGYRAIIVMPDSMSKERQDLMKARGAELVLTPGKEGMAGAVKKANEIKETTPGAIILQQFTNPANPAAHQRTAAEIWHDTLRQIDTLVAGVGTGGTVSGTAYYLRKQFKANIHVIAVEPASSPILNGGQAGPHKIQGIGANFIPDNYNANEIDEVADVTNEDAKAASRLLAEKEGVLAGISSGAALHAAIEYARTHDYRTIVVILPDTGERYLSTDLFID